jgi:uncharacterized protein YxjI
MQYPLALSFKIIALAPQIYVKDAQGQELLYVKQKLLKLKEKIRVFSDSGQSRQLYELDADRILDFSPRFTFRDAAGGQMVGAVKRQGARSLLKASYDIFGPDDRPIAHIAEENPWIKLLDAVLGEIPIIGAFTGYFLNPKYGVQDLASQRTMFQVTKHRSFLESRFEIARVESSPGEGAETAILLAILVMVLLERERG